MCVHERGDRKVESQRQRGSDTERDYKLLKLVIVVTAVVAGPGLKCLRLTKLRSTKTVYVLTLKKSLKP